MQAITLFKAQQLIGQLQTLGFPDWQCVPAIMVHGSDLEAAVTYLFEGSVHSEAEARQLLEGASSLTQIDISPELAQLQQAKVWLLLDICCEFLQRVKVHVPTQVTRAILTHLKKAYPIQIARAAQELPGNLLGRKFHLLYAPLEAT